MWKEPIAGNTGKLGQPAQACGTKAGGTRHVAGAKKATQTGKDEKETVEGQTLADGDLDFWMVVFHGRTGDGCE